MRFRLLITILAFALISCTAVPVPEPPSPGARVGEEEAPRDRAPAPRPARTTFRVGLLLPLSGPDRDLGQAFLKAAQMALFDFGNPALELMPKDAGDTPEQARAAAEAAVADGAQLLLGPIFRDKVAAAGIVARRENVPLIGFSNDRQVAGEGVLLAGFAPAAEVDRVIRFAASRGVMTFAAAIPETPYGNAVAQAFRRAVEEADAELVRMVTYPPDREGLFEPVKILADYDERRRALLEEMADLRSMGEDDDLAQLRLEDLKTSETLGDVPYDALLIPEGGSLLRSLAPLLPYYEIDPAAVRFLGTALWDDPSLIREPALIGGWYAAPPDKGRQAFQDRFIAVYGSSPPRLASLAYDAMALAATLGLERAEALNGAALPLALLLDPKGFRGLDGIFRFAGTGMAERGLAVMEITPRGAVVISQAPETFPPLGF